MAPSASSSNHFDHDSSSSTLQNGTNGSSNTSYDILGDNNGNGNGGDTPNGSASDHDSPSSNNNNGNGNNGGNNAANKAHLSEEQKKANHIASEKKRRNNIRDQYDKLASMTPGMEGQGRSEGKVLEEVVKRGLVLRQERMKLIEEIESKGGVVADELRRC